MSGLLSEVISCKKATIVMAFFTYICYSLVVGGCHFFEYKKD